MCEVSVDNFGRIRMKVCPIGGDASPEWPQTDGGKSAYSRRGRGRLPVKMKVKVKTRGSENGRLLGCVVPALDKASPFVAFLRHETSHQHLTVITKKWVCVTNLLDIPTKLIPVCPPFNTLSTETNITSVVVNVVHSPPELQCQQNRSLENK